MMHPVLAGALATLIAVALLFGTLFWGFKMGYEQAQADCAMAYGRKC